MEKHNTPFVPPEDGPQLFRRMRVAAEIGNSPKEPMKTEKSQEHAGPKPKNPEQVRKNSPLRETIPKFRNGASAMDDWQKEKEAREDQRWHKAA